MTLVLIIDCIVVLLLCSTALTKGFERTLPLAAFLIILFPFESQIILPGFFVLTTQRIIVVTLAGLYLFVGRRNQTRELPLKYLVLLLMAWMLVSTANSVVFIISLKAVLSQFFDFFVIYYIFAKSVSKSETVHQILFGFVLGMFVCSVFGFLEAYWNWSVINLFPAAAHTFSNLPGAADRSDRVQSSFGHAILFGGALAMAIPMAFYLVMQAKTSARKIFLWSAILLMFVNLFKTTSRGPWIAAIMSVTLSLLGGGRKMRRYLAVIGLLVTLTLVARPGVWETIRNLYGETLDSETAQGASYEWRYALYHVAFQHLNNDLGRAIWGYGPESFLYLGWKGEFQGAVVPFESCDSSVAELMIETGYLGFFIVVILFFAAVLFGLKSYFKMPRPSNSLCLVLLASLLAFYFLMTNVAILGWGQQSYMLWIVLALTMTYPGLVKRGVRRLQPTPESNASPALVPLTTNALRA